MARYLYSELSAVVEARLNCQQTLTQTAESHAGYRGEIVTARTWFDQWSEHIAQMVDDFLPHGSGFDNGTKIDLDASHASKLVFYTSFHHMNDGGFYTGWTEHTVTVTPSFRGINIRVGGRNHNDIKDYIHEEFDGALTQEIEWDKEQECWYSPDMRKAAADYQAKVASGEIT